MEKGTLPFLAEPYADVKESSNCRNVRTDPAEVWEDFRESAHCTAHARSLLDDYQALLLIH